MFTILLFSVMLCCLLRWLVFSFKLSTLCFRCSDVCVFEVSVFVFLSHSLFVLVVFVVCCHVFVNPLFSMFMLFCCFWNLCPNETHHLLNKTKQHILTNNQMHMLAKNLLSSNKNKERIIVYPALLNLIRWAAWFYSSETRMPTTLFVHLNQKCEQHCLHHLRQYYCKLLASQLNQNCEQHLSHLSQDYEQQCMSDVSQNCEQRCSSHQRQNFEIASNIVCNIVSVIWNKATSNMV